MRARHRHITKSLIEAACCFDSRFLTFSNNDAVDTWADLSSNGRDATQAVSANRPIFKTNVQGGNPVVRFDGSGDRLYTTTFSSPSAATAVMLAQANSWTLPGAYMSLAGHGYENGSDNTTVGISFVYLTPGNSEDWVGGDYLSFGSGFASSSVPRAIGPASSGSDFRVLSVALGPNKSTFNANGVRASTRVETTGSIAAFTRSAYIGGAAGDPSWLGDVALVIYFGYELSNAMITRLEHAAAHSFKIPCA